MYTTAEMAGYMQRRRRRFRRDLKRRLGGKCRRCGSTQRLVFDHVDPAEKAIRACFIADHCEEKREAEIAKLQLLCMSCHGSKNNVDGSSVLLAPRSCRCGAAFQSHYAYAGHRRWCDL